MLPINFNNTLPHSFGSSWKNLPPNFFGKKDESKQMRKGEGGVDLRQAPKGIQLSRECLLQYHLLLQPHWGNEGTGHKGDG